MQKGACSIPPPTTRRLLATAWRVDSAVFLPITKRLPETLSADMDARSSEDIMDPWPRTALRAWPRYRIHAMHLKNRRVG